MIRMNSRFVDRISSLRAGITEISLEARLATIVDAGIISVNDVFLLRELANAKTNVTTASFQDKTGYECFMNHLHIEEYAGEQPMTQAVLFAAGVLTRWVSQKFHGQLVAIVGSDEESVVVRFHYKRPNEFWLAEDLDGYELESVLEISSSDLSFFDLLRTEIG
jgi:hypothetical protein